MKIQSAPVAVSKMVAIRNSPKRCNSQPNPKTKIAYTRLTALTSLMFLGGLFSCGDGGASSTPAPKVNPNQEALDGAAVLDGAYPYLNGGISFFIQRAFQERVDYNNASVAFQFTPWNEANNTYGPFQVERIGVYSAHVIDVFQEIKINLGVFLTGGEFEQLSSYDAPLPNYPLYPPVPLPVDQAIMGARSQSMAFSANMSVVYENLAEILTAARDNGDLGAADLVNITGFLTNQLGFLITRGDYKGGEVYAY